jgi:hypothetical protein
MTALAQSLTKTLWVSYEARPNSNFRRRKDVSKRYRSQAFGGIGGGFCGKGSGGGVGLGGVGVVGFGLLGIATPVFLKNGNVLV